MPAVTNYHQSGGLNPHIFSYSLGDWKSETSVFRLSQGMSRAESLERLKGRIFVLDFLSLLGCLCFWPFEPFPDRFQLSLLTSSISVGDYALLPSDKDTYL